MNTLNCFILELRLPAISYSVFFSPIAFLLFILAQIRRSGSSVLVDAERLFVLDDESAGRRRMQRSPCSFKLLFFHPHHFFHVFLYFTRYNGILPGFGIWFCIFSAQGSRTYTLHLGDFFHDTQGRTRQPVGAAPYTISFVIEYSSRFIWEAFAFYLACFLFLRIFFMEITTTPSI